MPDGSPYIYNSGDAAVFAVSSDRTADGVVFSLDLDWDSTMSRWIGVISAEQTDLLTGDARYFMDAKLSTAGGVWSILDITPVYVYPSISEFDE